MLEEQENLLLKYNNLDPTDQKEVADYLSALRNFSEHSIGITYFRWPGVPYPLYFRCGTSDLANFMQIFVRKEYGFPIPFTPERILDLGAYVGYASVYLALKFPNASIIAVEPVRDNFRILTLNTSAYSNIQTLNAGVWGSRSQLALEPQEAKDWGTRFNPATDTNQGSVEAFTVHDILDRFGWLNTDYLKCDIEGAELSVFKTSGEYISTMVNCCAIEIHDTVAPGSSQLVESCFDPNNFIHNRSGEFDVFLRRGIDDNERPPPRFELLRPFQGTREIRLMNVPEKPWGFYIFGGNSCQLHPGLNPISVPEVSTVVCFENQSFFECGLAVENPLGFAIKFTFQIRRHEDETIVLDASRIVNADQKQEWLLPIPRLCGRYRVAFQTMMAGNGRTNHKACANWISPNFR